MPQNQITLKSYHYNQKEEQLDDRKDVGENSCNSGDGTDQTGPILDVYEDDEDYDNYFFGINLFGSII